MSSNELPDSAGIVIIGGGIIGCSVAYHLTKLGWRDVVLLEQGQLSSGTTWHAAGLVGQLRSHSSMTGLIQYSTKLYAELEAETGLATGWKNCGSLAVARTSERMTQLKRTASSARAQGVDVELISAKEAGDLWPIMAIDDLQGGICLPGDGKANPTDLTQSLAKGARNGGAKIIERIRVTDVITKNRVVSAVETDQGTIKTQIIVNCAGQWARKVGKMCGVSVPLHSAEHMYIVTGQIEGAHTDLPVLRDPDGYIYFKEEVGGLAMGGFEPEAKPWGMDGIPDDFEFSLLPDDWDHFEILMENALQRVPQLDRAEVRKFYNGPESFTPDNNFLLGEAPELKNFFIGAGFNSMGIASAGGAGKALAEWIVNGAPTLDLWPVDIRRFAGFNNNPTWLRERIKETLGLHYAMPWPNRELETARPFRRSPLYDRLSDKGGVFGSRMGWERPNWFAAAGEQKTAEYSFGRQNWHEAVRREHEAVRNHVGIFDQSSFSKLMVEGKDACQALNYICAADIDKAVGTSVYTGMLNERGTYESDLTVLRLGDQKFLIITGSAQTIHDADWIRKNTADDAHCHVSDVTSAWSVLSIMGPNSRKLLERVSRANFSNKAFPFSTVQEIDIGYATAYANRMTYVGELGWELIVPTEFTVGVYDLLHLHGSDFGLRDAGYYALEGLRIEKGFRAWSRELSPEINPFEAGLAFAVDMNKPDGFIGKQALMKQQAAGVLKRRIVLFTLEDPDAQLWGGELIIRNGTPIGEVRSASYGHTLGSSIALAVLENQAGIDSSFIATGQYQIDLAGELHNATAHLRTPYDPKSQRVKA